MLVRSGFEPATSSSADRRSPNWANQVGFTRYLSLSLYNPFFYLNTFSKFSFLFQESLCVRCLRKICHHVSSTLTVGTRYIGPWSHYCADQSLPSFASTHYFCFFFFNSSGSYFNGFLSLAVLLVTVVRRVKDIFRFVDRVQPVKVKSVCKAGEREGYLSLPSLRCFMNMFTALSLVCENCAEVHYD